MRAYYVSKVCTGVVFSLILSSVANVLQAGPFSPAAGQPGSDAIHKDDPRFVEWANNTTSLVRGPQNITNPGFGSASFGTSANALGKAEGSLVSLGDGGSITLTFQKAITNGPGADLAVFENGFVSGSLYYLELGFVEVSSNGADFFRFPSISATQTTTQVGSFDLLDATNLYDLAGKYVANYGTPFDLQELVGVSQLLNVNDVRYVRVVDVVGSIDPLYATLDSLGNKVNDPWSTAFASGGFDFDAVGVINAVPEPGAALLAAIGGLILSAMRICKTRRRYPPN